MVTVSAAAIITILIVHCLAEFLVGSASTGLFSFQSGHMELQGLHLRLHHFQDGLNQGAGGFGWLELSFGRPEMSAGKVVGAGGDTSGDTSEHDSVPRAVVAQHTKRVVAAWHVAATH